jgi:hypothetical protein
MLTANLKFRIKIMFLFFSFLFSKQISKDTLVENNYVPIKHKQISFVSNGGKFKLYTVLNGLLFLTPTQPRISFERTIVSCDVS